MPFGTYLNMKRFPLDYPNQILMISSQCFFRIKIFLNNKPKSMQRFEKRSQKWDITFMELKGIENDNTLGA